MKRDYYAGKDQKCENEKSVYSKISTDKASYWNDQGYGIFWTVNQFDGRRKKENLTHLNSWYVEMEDEDKSIQMSRLELSPVPPSLIIESKRGYHVYWDCRNATLDNYKLILTGLQEHFKGDSNASDVTRLLRVPGYKHLKDPSDPFPVQVVWEWDGQYSEGLMIYSFVNEPETKTTSQNKHHEHLVAEGADIWSKAMSLDCEIALKRLSGTSYVNQETFSFKPNDTGTLNILVNGKESSAWIDANKKIGSMSKGGPGIAQWLHWYGHPYSQVRQILLDVFPEVR